MGRMWLPPRSVESGRVELGSSAARHDVTPPVGFLSRRIRSCVWQPLRCSGRALGYFIRRRRGGLRRADDDGDPVVGQYSPVGSKPIVVACVYGGRRRIMRFLAAGQNRTGAHATAVFRTALLFGVEK